MLFALPFARHGFKEGCDKNKGKEREREGQGKKKRERQRKRERETEKDKEGKIGKNGERESTKTFQEMLEN